MDRENSTSIPSKVVVTMPDDDESNSNIENDNTTTQTLTKQYEVFSNNLIWKALGKYLNWSDMKEVRLVCQNFNNKILDHTPFKEDVVVNLIGDRLGEYVFGTTFQQWKNFKIMVSSPDLPPSEGEGEDIDCDSDEEKSEEDDDDDENQNKGEDIDIDENECSEEEDEGDDVDIDENEDAYSEEDEDENINEDEDDEDEEFEGEFVDKCMEVSDEEEEGEAINIKKKKKQQQQDDDEEDKSNFDWLYPMLESATEIFVTSSSECDSGWRHICPPIPKLLEAPTYLKKLAIDTQIVTGEVDGIFGGMSDKARTALENLQEFKIALHESPDVMKPLSKYTVNLPGSADASFSTFTGFLAPIMKNLKVLTVDSLVDDVELELEQFQVIEELHLKVQNLLTLINNNSMTLTTLELNDLHSCSTSANEHLISIFKLSFPALKSLKVRVHQIEGENFANFLLHQPPLEKLDIVMLFDFSNKLWDAIRKRSKNLKRLRIKAKCFAIPEDNLWTFLNQLKYLKGIQIEFLHSDEEEVSDQNSGSVKSILKNLPSSVKNICLGGFPPSDDDDSSMLTSMDFANIVHPDKLTQLKLAKCDHSVDDVTLKFICKNFTMLRSLEISHNSNVTDFGFTGIPPESSDRVLCTFSLQNLKRLQTLVLKCCTQITDLTCFYGISFLELVFLDLFGNNKITKDGILEVVKKSRNPSLQTLRSSHIRGLPYAHEITETYNPRFKRHIISYRDCDPDFVSKEEENESYYDMVSVSGSEEDLSLINDGSISEASDQDEEENFYMDNDDIEGSPISSVEEDVNDLGGDEFPAAEEQPEEDGINDAQFSSDEENFGDYLMGHQSLGADYYGIDFDDVINEPYPIDDDEDQAYDDFGDYDGDL